MAGTSLEGLTIYFNDHRFYFRPQLWNSMRVTDLAKQGYALVMQVTEYKYAAADLWTLLDQMPDSHAFITLRAPDKVVLYLRTLEEFKADTELWEEVITTEFPSRRHHMALHQDQDQNGESSSTTVNNNTLGTIQKEVGELLVSQPQEREFKYFEALKVRRVAHHPQMLLDMGEMHLEDWGWEWPAR